VASWCFTFGFLPFEVVFCHPPNIRNPVNITPLVPIENDDIPSGGHARTLVFDPVEASVNNAIGKTRIQVETSPIPSDAASPTLIGRYRTLRRRSSCPLKSMSALQMVGFARTRAAGRGSYNGDGPTPHFLPLLTTGREQKFERTETEFQVNECKWKGPI
jgi:hypothetical protein